MVKDCVVTPCGHSFCRSCAGDAVTRKHSCPVCQVGVIGGEAGLIRNFLVDEVTQTLRRATEDTDVAYMRLLFDNASASACAPSSSALPQPPSDVLGNHQSMQVALPQQQQHAPPPTNALSPVENVLVNRMREAFLGYQSYYARERAAHEAEVVSLSLQLKAAQLKETLGVGDAALETADSAGRHAVEALKIAIEESRARFQAGMEALLRDFDAHAAAAAPPPSLLPSTVTVILASRGVRFDTQLLPTHFPENVYNKVKCRSLYMLSLQTWLCFSLLWLSVVWVASTLVCRGLNGLGLAAYPRRCVPVMSQQCPCPARCIVFFVPTVAFRYAMQKGLSVPLRRFFLNGLLYFIGRVSSWQDSDEISF